MKQSIEFPISARNKLLLLSCILAISLFMEVCFEMVYHFLLLNIKNSKGFLALLPDEFVMETGMK